MADHPGMSEHLIDDAWWGGQGFDTKHGGIDANKPTGHDSLERLNVDDPQR
jgi:hypothetical protein